MVRIKRHRLIAFNCFLIFSMQAFSSIGFSQTESPCVKVKLVEHSSKAILPVHEACIDKKHIHMISKNCQKQECGLYKKIQELSKNETDLFSEIENKGRGNPGYSLCRKAKGKTVYVETDSYFSGVAGLGICTFEADQSFADMGTILGWIGFGQGSPENLQTK